MSKEILSSNSVVQTNQPEQYSKVLLQEKYQAIGMFSAGITHEINTPLTYIKANLDMLSYDIEDIDNLELQKSINNNISTIKSGLIRLENIVTSIKELAISPNQDFKVLNIYSTIVDSITSIYNKTQYISDIYLNGQLFTLDIDKNRYNYFANIQEQRMKQVWMIILNNAIDELIKIDDIQNRRIDIDISSSNNKISIKFKDNAGGIPKDELQHIFEPFKGSKPSSGMGVGLGIAKQIIEDHKGATIKAYNENNCAIFQIDIVESINKNI